MSGSIANIREALLFVGPCAMIIGWSLGAISFMITRFQLFELGIVLVGCGIVLSLIVSHYDVTEDRLEDDSTESNDDPSQLFNGIIVHRRKRVRYSRNIEDWCITIKSIRRNSSSRRCDIVPNIPLLKELYLTVSRVCTAIDFMKLEALHFHSTIARIVFWRI